MTEIETRTIDGQAFAAGLRTRLAAAVQELERTHAVIPGLATVLVGDDPASGVYVRSKIKASQAVGLRSFSHTLPASATAAQLLDLIATLNADHAVDGILVQLPLPAGLEAQAAIAALDPAKDVDGLHPSNIGRLWADQPGFVPCTPQGCLMLIQDILGPDLAGQNAVVIGRSTLVGRPMAALLLGQNCTVTMAHSRTRDLPEVCRRADILVAAVGRAELVRGGWIKPGATVIDVGTTRRVGADGKARLVGDVAFAEARGIAGAITPVPGGVGPMTIACLLRNTLVAAHRRAGLADPEGF